MKKVYLSMAALLVAAMTSCSDKKTEAEKEAQEKVDEAKEQADEAINAAKEVVDNYRDMADDVPEFDSPAVPDVDVSYESSASSSSSEDWDSVLDSYEEFVDDYIRFAKKAKSGDMSAMADMAKYMEKAKELGNKLQGAKSSMSSSQIARYTQIVSKMSRAAM